MSDAKRKPDDFRGKDLRIDATPEELAKAVLRGKRVYPRLPEPKEDEGECSDDEHYSM